MPADSQPSERVARNTQVTLDEDVLEAAHALGIDLGEAAEAGVAAAVRCAREKAWLEENREAIAAYNDRIRREGTLLTPQWAEDEEGGFSNWIGLTCLASRAPLFHMWLMCKRPFLKPLKHRLLFR